MRPRFAVSRWTRSPHQLKPIKSGSGGHHAISVTRLPGTAPGTAARRRQRTARQFCSYGPPVTVRDPGAPPFPGEQPVRN